MVAGPVLPKPGDGSDKVLGIRSGAEETTPTLSSDWIYIIQPVDKLPSIDVTHTVAGAIVGRRRARAVDQWIVHIAARYSTLWHVLGFTFIALCLFVFFVKTAFQKTLVSIVFAVCMGPLLWIHAASLCWDVLLLLFQMFEFWFIQLVNIVDFVVYIMLFRDIRILALLILAPSCVLTAFLDANLHTRLVVIRLFIAGSPVILVAAALIFLRLPPDLRSTPVYIGDVQLDLIDVLTSGSFTTAYFLVMRLLPYRRRILSFLRTNCRLIPHDAWLQMRHRIVALGPLEQRLNVNATQLELVDQDQLRSVDAWETIGSVHYPNLMCGRLPRWFAIVLNAAGMVGTALLLYCSVQHVYFPNQRAPRAGILVAFISTLLFISAHIVHCQQALIRRVLLEIDAWFISIQATLVSLGACDAFTWDHRSLLVAVAWLWCHWIICLDALPPITRRRLALSRWFVLFVNVVLLLYPVWLAYMLFFSAEKATLRNRVILHTNFADVEIRTQMLSFISSRIFTLWMWMGRFLWVESFRPHDAFKIVKHRVHFAVQRH